jgi:hypothetical protein
MALLPLPAAGTGTSVSSLLAAALSKAHIEDAGGRRAGQSRAGRRITGDTAWHSVSAHWEAVSCSLATWAMVELIALSSESDSDEGMDTLMLLYLTPKRQKSVWKSVYMKRRKTHGEFALTSEVSDKQFTKYLRLNRSQYNEVHRLVQNSIKGVMLKNQLERKTNSPCS